VKRKLIATTILALPLLGFAAANMTFEPGSALWVEGGSTVRSWKCTAKQIDAQVAGDATASLAQMVSGATVGIPVAQLECGNGKMNEHMRKALDAEKNPAIQFTLSSYDVNGTAATLKGTLQIAGSTKPIEIPASVTDDGKEVRVKAARQINMKEWGVKPPSLMMGTMKVKEVVTVGFDVTLKR